MKENTLKWRRLKKLESKLDLLSFLGEKKEKNGGRKEKIGMGKMKIELTSFL